MAKERPSDVRQKPKDSKHDGQKKRKGFSIGPANLPDGTYKRKVDKIKRTLIHKAKVKKSYNKTLASADPSADPNAIRARKLLEEAEQERQTRRMQAQGANEENKKEEGGDGQPTGDSVHPERQAAIDAAAAADGSERSASPERRERRKRRPKTSSYKRQEEIAARKKEDREKRQQEAERRQQEREQKEKERERRKKAMSARTHTGQFKLGKMSHILLSQVEEQMKKEKR